jgi:hypothetical protein
MGFENPTKINKRLSLKRIKTKIKIMQKSQKQNLI